MFIILFMSVPNINVANIGLYSAHPSKFINKEKSFLKMYSKYFLIFTIKYLSLKVFQYTFRIFLLKNYLLFSIKYIRKMFNILYSIFI